MNFRRIIMTLVLMSGLIGTPVFAASTTSLKTQQQKFQGVLDAYLNANQKLETQITNTASLNEQTRDFLLSLVRGEKSDLYTLRSSVFSSTSTKDIQQLARAAQEKRAQMKLRDSHIVTPLLQISDFEINSLPTAEARLATLDTTLTKAQYDRAVVKLAAVRTDTATLHAKLLGTHPPSDALSQVQGLHTRIINLYRDLRSKVK